ncbi:MAG: aldo/keto reductase [Pseudomonadota bacterium]
MKHVTLGNSHLVSSQLVYGCMRTVGDGSQRERKKGKDAIAAAIEAGYNHFDHADIYGQGECETLFGEFLRENPGTRESLIITSKCGIRFRDTPNPGDPGRYDFSAEHITKSVEGSLTRLDIDRLDILLLHRPDYLFDAIEVAEALVKLKEQGKVSHFGLSNFSPSQVSLLWQHLGHDLLLHQVEINIHNIDAFANGVLDQCQQLRISPQAWAPVAGVVRTPLNDQFTEDDYRRIQQELERQSDNYGLEDWVVVLSWLLKHPANILPVIGSIQPTRIQSAVDATALDYSREDWYRLLEARNGQPVP